MLASVRAGFAAALVAFFSFTAFAADKPFQRSDLADSAVRLETQIKTESGQIAKPVATLRSEAEAAFAKRDFRAGMQTLAQIVSVAPRYRGQLAPPRPRHPADPRLRRQRARELPPARRHRRLYRLPALRQCRRGGRRAGAARPHLLGPQAVPARARRLPARRSTCARSPRSRQTYEALRDQHGFRILDYSVDADAASPRACFQFSEDLPGKRTDFSPFVALAGNDKPAITTEEKQLCVEGLKHGERYSVTLRAGLPSTVRETLQRRPTTTSMCATAARSCASPARPMCCRAPASAAFRW